MEYVTLESRALFRLLISGLITSIPAEALMHVYLCTQSKTKPQVYLI